MKDYNALSLEVEALDKIHVVLARPENKGGLTVSCLAKEIGVAIGYLEGILRNSKHVIRRKGYKWVVEWNDLNDWLEWMKREDRHSFQVLLDGTLVRRSETTEIRLPGAIKIRRQK